MAHLTVSLANNEFDGYSTVKMTGLRLELGGELLERVEDNIGAAERKQESGAVRVF